MEGQEEHCDCLVKVEKSEEFVGESQWNGL